MKKSLSVLSLFTSSATLLCCALPFLLVSMGAGAVVAGMASNIPGLVWLSERKVMVFIIAGALLALNYMLQKNNQAACPIDQQGNCEQAKSYAHIIFYISVGIYMVGAFFAFVLPKILN